MSQRYRSCGAGEAEHTASHLATAQADEVFFDFARVLGRNRT
jgi:hypothetical protein